jgi:hypothetical protein
MITVDQIKARWPLASMLARCNIQVSPRGKFPSPFRPDQTPSCEIYGETIKDRSTGDTFDAIAIYAEHKGLSNSDAIKALAAELPGRQGIWSGDNRGRHGGAQAIADAWKWVLARMAKKIRRQDPSRPEARGRHRGQNQKELVIVANDI